MPNIQEMLLAKLKGDVQTEFSIEFQPDRTDDTTKYLLTGTQPELRSQISMLMAIKQLIGESKADYNFEKYEQFVYENPTPLAVQIHWRLGKGRPFEPEELVKAYTLNKATPPRPYCTFLIDRSKLTWSNIKAAAGGNNGKLWGHHYAVARPQIKEGNLIIKCPQIKIYSSTEQQATEELEAILDLTPAGSYTMTEGKEIQNKGQRAIDPGYRKPTTRVYPAWFYIINHELVDAARVEASRGRSTTLGKLLKKCHAIELFQDEETAEHRSKIANMMRKIEV